MTYIGPDGSRIERLECNTDFLRVSKHGIWVHRKVAVAQEKAVARFHSGWSNFADWINETTKDSQKLTYRQSKRLFVEHFGRRLLLVHGKQDTFTTSANASTDILTSDLRDVLGCDGGSIVSSMHHGCQDCTHKKRYKADLIAEGAVFGENATDLADSPEHIEDFEDLTGVQPVS